jgi:hypothetical protein
VANRRRAGDGGLVLNASGPEQAEVVVWRHAGWRCELWIVNRAPRLRLFQNETVVRDFGVAGAREAIQLGNAWRTTVSTSAQDQRES